MTRRLRVAFIGNSLPRRCGISTFTTDLQQAVANAPIAPVTGIIGMNDRVEGYNYPPQVLLSIDQENIKDYERAADFLNTSQYDVVSLQHEFGIFGGVAGDKILALLSRLRMPVVTTLHTILSDPTPMQRVVMGRLLELSAKVVVMADKGRELLLSVYHAPADKIEIVAHGIPDFAFVKPDAAKEKFGFASRTVILTFGLLSPNKGVEFVIDAMPSILEACPDAVYVILGATHPNLVRDQGEAYRDGMVTRARKLGVADHVVFIDKFVELADLLDYIAMCDVYVTPYLDAAQMTSGTLAYSFGLGKAIVSTPYWHAQELLADGRGILVPFADAKAIGIEITALLGDETRREAIRRRAYNASRSMTWERTAERYLSIFANARQGPRLNIVAHQTPDHLTGVIAKPPEMQLEHFHSMCDNTGLFQHAIHSVPDRHHGYCVDDNARALLLACALNAPGEERLPEATTARFASFVQHAFNPDTLRFRNFMSFDRRWLEDRGSEDSHGRTLWALGECLRNDASTSRRRWAQDLFDRALPVVENFSSPRAWAFTLLGLHARLAASPEDPVSRKLQHNLAARLMNILAKVETCDRAWFEKGLAYDNARLPQALILSGQSTGEDDFTMAGLRTLRWLMTVQTASAGHFRPVGTKGFGDINKPPQAFDQQPLEATATISACLAAYRADGDIAWKAHATNAFDWFLGQNDLATPLVEIETGSCRDGLHPDRANENRGGESVLSYLLGLAELRQCDRVSEDRTRLAPAMQIRA